MISPELYRSHLLNSIPTAIIASGGRQINCRCFFCPDGKSASSKHFYISIPQNEKEPSLYYCHKCHSSGVMNYKKLIEWDIYNDEVAIELINHNKHCDVNSMRKYTDKTHYIMKCLTTSDTNVSAIKLKYINERLGTNFSYEDLRKLKIILNLKDLLRDNGVTNLTRNANIVDQLDINFLGFLSIDNAFLNMRRICDEGLVYEGIDKRYINYKIFDKFDTSERFYTIPTTINVLDANRIKIHIAEGPFDILSIYKNVRKEEPGIYTCIAGSNYKAIAMYFIENYKLPLAELHFYPDNDKYGATTKIQKIAQYFFPMNIPVYLHRNTFPGQKDFGVSPDKIQEAIQPLNPYYMTGV